MARRPTATTCACGCSASRAAIRRRTATSSCQPTDPAADAGYVIMEQVEYPGMSGTNTMCVVTVLLETGMLPMTEPVTELTLEAPGRAHPGPGRLRGRQGHRASRSATFPPSRRTSTAPVEVPQLGTVVVDVAYGGMFYVIADAEPFGLRLTPDEGADIVRITEMIKAAANEQLPVVHPEQPGFAGSPSGSCRARPTIRPTAGGTSSRSRRARSTGSARRPGPAPSIARRAGPGRRPRWPSCTPGASWRVGDEFRHEGILGTVFTGRVVEETTIGPYRAIVPTITGQAWITGFASYVVDPTDPFPDGFTIGDIWG